VPFVSLDEVKFVLKPLESVKCSSHSVMVNSQYHQLLILVELTH